MAEGLLLFWLIALAVTQAAWCVYYFLRYDWGSTPLGPVWLAKGGLFAVLWPLLVVNEFVHLNKWIWAGLIGPALWAATFAWLVVTIRVARRGGDNPRP